MVKRKFKEKYSFEQRKKEAANVRTKYPDRIPVVVERDPGSTIPTVDKHRFLVPDDISVAHFMWIIRKRIQLAPEKAIFLFIDRMLPQSSATMGEIYREHSEEDGFLYIIYSGESTFGFNDQ
ncbi:gamma-aminobutyric acid receptor-associated protein-like 2 isoform X3 [Tachypleus tridentatus]|uniref:gamma-aminobutyric acid receptor-associated protein-like 2 isoform X3 n=1 Tax=Tachypleus tridentatus TaxID=6853 RepID=UPI003FD37F77